VSDEPILVAIAKRDDLRAEIAKSRADLMARCAELQTRIDAVAERLDRMVRLYGR